VYGAGYCLELPSGSQLEELASVIQDVRQTRKAAA
jgi:hypothetical protein